MRVAITGGSGALGSALIQRLIADGAERIVTFTRSQHHRDIMTRAFGSYPGIANRIYCHDMSNVARLEETFSGCEIVIHAAAAKVVGAHPDEVRVMRETNQDGTANVIDAAFRAGVTKVLVISSDKAVSPTNVYGASKFCAEQLAIAANAKTWPAARYNPHGTRVSAIRYGNVASSTGSVSVKWREAVAKGEPITISDPRMTRFWLTLPQAVGYVLDAVSMMRGGEIFVPELPAAPITTLAKALGAHPPYTVTGIRPGGEKLHESLLSEDDVRRTVKWRGFYVVTPSMRTWDATPWPGEPIPEDTVYRSDVSKPQLTVEQMKALVS